MTQTPFGATMVRNWAVAWRLEVAGQTYALPLYGYGRRLKETTMGHDTTRSTHPTANPPNTHARHGKCQPGARSGGLPSLAGHPSGIPAAVLGALYAGHANGDGVGNWFPGQRPALEIKQSTEAPNTQEKQKPGKQGSMRLGESTTYVNLVRFGDSMAPL